MRESDAAGVQRLLGNFGWLASGEALSRAVGFVLALYLARTLGAEGYGSVGIALALVGFLGILVRAGTAPAAIRDVAQDPDCIPEIFPRLIGLRLMVAAISIGLLTVALPVLAPALSAPGLVLFLFSLGLLPAAMSVGWAFRGMEQMRVVTIGLVAERVLTLLGVVLLVHEPERDLLRVPIVYGLAAVAVTAWMLIALRRERPGLAIRIEPGTWGPMLREGVPVGLSMGLRMLYSNGGVLFLGALVGAAAAGEYLVGQKVVLTFSIIAVVVHQASFPATSRVLRRDLRRALRLQATLYRFILAALVPVILVGWIAAEPIVAGLFGDGYPGAPQALRILVLTLPVVAFTGTLRQVLLAAALPRPFLIGVAVGAAAHVAAALLLIPGLGASGAAFACLAGELVGMLFLSALVRNRLGALPLDRSALAPIAAGAIALLPLSSSAISWPIAAAAALVLYSAAAAALGLGRGPEVAAVRELLQRPDVKRS